MTPPERVLGIETSCDETAAAVVADGARVLSSVVRGQDDAARALRRRRAGARLARPPGRRSTRWSRAALERGGRRLGELTGVAVTAGPGLLGSLLVGLSLREGARLSRWAFPCVGVHHLAGHLAAAELADACAGAALRRPRRLRRPHRALPHRGGRAAGAARRDPRRRRRRGLRQGREAARPRRTPAARRSRSWRSRATRRRSPSRAPLAERARPRLLLQRAQDRGDPRDRAPARRRRPRRARDRRPRRLVPGRGHGPARAARAARAARGRRSAASPWSGGVAANPRLRREMERAGARGRLHGAASRRPSSAPTTPRWWRRPARACSRAASATTSRSDRLLARAAGGAPLGAGVAGVSPAEIRALLERHGLRARKDLGQNFLADERVAAKLAADAPASRPTTRCSRSAAGSAC